MFDGWTKHKSQDGYWLICDENGQPFCKFLVKDTPQVDLMAKKIEGLPELLYRAEILLNIALDKPGSLLKGDGLFMSKAKTLFRRLRKL